MVVQKLFDKTPLCYSMSVQAKITDTCNMFTKTAVIKIMQNSCMYHISWLHINMVN